MSIDSFRSLRREDWFIKSIKDRSCCSLTPVSRKCTHIRTDQEVRKPCRPSPGACVSLCDLYKGCDVWPTAKVGSPTTPSSHKAPGLHSSLDTADDLRWSLYMQRIKSELLFWNLNLNSYPAQIFGENSEIPFGAVNRELSRQGQEWFDKVCVCECYLPFIIFRLN